jgi:hypothetical protein
MLPPLLPSHKWTRDGQLCQQGTIFCSAAIVIVRCHPHCCHQCHCRSKQGTANNGKAPLSALPPPSLLHTVVCIAAVVVIVKQGKEQATMPRHHCPCCCCLLSLRIIGRTAAVVAVACEGKECPTMPRHFCLHSRHLGSRALLRRCHCCHHARGQDMANNAKAPSSSHLFTLLPLLLSCEQAWDSQQCRQGTIFHSATNVVTHHHPCCCNKCSHMNKQRMGQCQGTVVRAAATVIVPQSCSHC